MSHPPPECAGWRRFGRYGTSPGRLAVGLGWRRTSAWAHRRCRCRRCSKVFPCRTHGSRRWRRRRGIAFLLGGPGDKGGGMVGGMESNIVPRASSHNSWDCTAFRTLNYAQTEPSKASRAVQITIRFSRRRIRHSSQYFFMFSSHEYQSRPVKERTWYSGSIVWVVQHSPRTQTADRSTPVREFRERAVVESRAQGSGQRRC